MRALAGARLGGGRAPVPRLRPPRRLGARVCLRGSHACTPLAAGGVRAPIEAIEVMKAARSRALAAEFYHRRRLLTSRARRIAADSTLSRRIHDRASMTD